MYRLLVPAALLVGLAVVADGQPFPAGLPKLKPLEPADAAKAFEAPPGFRVELAAAEPLVRSPVAMDFDENGRLYVAEFPEYNQYANPTPSKARGCVKLLEDTDGDGFAYW